YFDIAEGQFESCIKDKIEDMVLGLDENLDGILPPLRDILGAGAADEMYLKLEPQQKRQKILEALRGLLIRLSQERPLILALEDLHWIDKSSEEFLTYLIEGMAGARILLVLLCRPEYSPPWSHKTYYTQISLDRLSDESATRMIQALLPEAQVSSDLNTFVVNKGEGNPLYIEELARNLIENGAVEREENRHILARGAREIQVPLTIQGIIAARIDRLELIVKQTLQVASVIGRDFSFGLLCQIRGGTQELGTHLQSLVQLEFIHQKTQFPEPEYTFKHALTQEVAYNSLLSRERRRLHQEIGRTIEAFHSAPEESAEMLAHHYCGSENWEKANWYLKLSGNKAVRSYANQEAIHFYEKSLVALKNMPCTKENINRQIEGLVLLLTPVVLMGFPQGHTEHLQEGERLAREAGDMRSLALFYNALAMYNCMHGIGSTATVYFDKALKAAEQVEDPELTARIAFDRWFRHFTQGTFAEMVEDTPQLSDMLDKTHRKYDLFGGGINSNLYATFCVGYGFCLGLTGRFDNGEAWCQEALEVAQRLDDPRTSALVYHIAGLVYHAMGRNKETILFFRSALEYVSETQTLWMAYQCNEFLGVAYAELGERQACQGFLDELRDSELTPINSGTIWPTGIAYLELGEMDEARTWLEKALIHCERIGEQCGQGIARIYLGRLWGKQEIPQYDEAEELLLEGIRRLEALQLKPWSTKGYLYLGELYGDMGQRDKAMENLTKAETAFREMGMNFWLQRTYQVLDRLK
ncbi:MAG: tetratricopeptide repeat protein, partial [Chloroflexota bacterium]|nr:tetratricopeptide repeat protein [Chloroflexota bacterium]